MARVYSRLAQLITENKPAALATVVSGELVGAKLLVAGDGRREGSIHPELDALVEAAARDLLAAEKSQAREYMLNEEKIEVFIETFPPPQRLIIIGAVHVAIPLHRLAKMLGYHVTVVDARGLLTTAQRFPLADAIMVEWPDDALKQVGLDTGSSVVVLTHDPKFDHPALLTALQSDARYIGAIGSRVTNEQRFAALRDAGMSDEQLARIYAPVGLDIGAQSPSEIALAVLAEIVATRHKRGGGHLRNRSALLPQALETPA